MIRPRITWALALMLCAVLVACGESDDPDPGGGAGGTGGTGGTGGSGGGGSGGTGGGDVADCGNDVVESGEECDDGNTEPGDGCDATCHWESEVTPCDDAIVYRVGAGLVNTQDPMMPGTNRSRNGTIEVDSNALLAGSCGGDGQETVYSFIPDGKGVLLWRLYNTNREGLASGFATYAMTTCSTDPAPACTVDGKVGQILVDGASEVFIVVDSLSAVEETVGFNLVTSWLDLREEGEECDPTGQTDTCRQGYSCEGDPAECSEGTAPVIERAVAYLGDMKLNYIVAEGTDPDGDIVGYYIEPLDEAGEPMVIFDHDNNGTPESSRRYIDNAHVVLASREAMGLRTEEGSWFAKIPIFSQVYGFVYIYPWQHSPSSIRLSMVDATGLEGPPFVAEAPVFAELGEACDNDGFVPCVVGLLCRTTCIEGTPPEISRAAYGVRPDGVQALVVSGVDIDDDLVAIRFEMIDADDNVIIMDYDGDGTVDDSSTDIAMTTNDDTTFLGSPTIPAAWKAKNAPKVALTPIDSLGLKGVRWVVDNTPIPVMAAGEECSLEGWNVCETGLDCVGDTPRCTHPRDLVCEAAQAIDATELEPGVDIVLEATGTLTAPGFWDPPAGCGAKTGMPDGIVVLRLPEGVTELTLSTNNEETKDGIPFGDSILYLLPTACGSGEALGCNDNADPGSGILGSTLELGAVPAGEYTVVVDSVDSTAAAGTFKLDVILTIAE